MHQWVTPNCQNPWVDTFFRCSLREHCLISQRGMRWCLLVEFSYWFQTTNVWIHFKVVEQLPVVNEAECVAQNAKKDDDAFNAHWRSNLGFRTLIYLRGNSEYTHKYINCQCTFRKILESLFGFIKWQCCFTFASALQWAIYYLHILCCSLSGKHTLRLEEQMPETKSLIPTTTQPSGLVQQSIWQHHCSLIGSIKCCDINSPALMFISLELSMVKPQDYDDCPFLLVEAL